MPLDLEIVTKGPASVQDARKYPLEAHPDPEFRRSQLGWLIAFGVFGLIVMGVLALGLTLVK